MRPFLLLIVILTCIAITSCNKNNCECEPPPPPLAHTDWKMVNYSGGLAGVNIDLPADQQHTLSFALYRFSATSRPSGSQTNGSFSIDAAPAGYDDAFMIKFDRPVPIFASDQLIVVKNRNDSLVLQLNVADSYLYTFTKLK
ncbi:MAG: hypothetical protein ABW007_00180 [Chitinophagaceae bacterium]